MEPGGLGLLALLVVVPAGRALAFFVSRKLQHVSQAASRLVEHSIWCVAVGTFFWFWASYKLLTKHDPDMGTVTFLIANVLNYRTADLCSVLARRPRRGTIKSLAQQQSLAPAATSLVALNYLLALFIPGLPATFRVYLVAGGGLWLAAALRTYALHSACDFQASQAAHDGSQAPLASSSSDAEEAARAGWAENPQ